MFDIIIAGGGPAGSNLARLLAHTYGPKYKICLLDKRRLDQPEDTKHQKACGGLLSPDAQAMLAKLGLTIPVSVLEDPQIFKVRTIDFDNHYERYYQRYYFNMNRERFDRYLYNLIPATVDCRCGTLITDAYKANDLWHVTYTDYQAQEQEQQQQEQQQAQQQVQQQEQSTSKQNEKSNNEKSNNEKSNNEKSNIENKTSADTKTITAKLLVCADGANSFLRRKLVPAHPASPRYISVQKWYPVGFEQQNRLSVAKQHPISATREPSVNFNMPFYTGIFDTEITDYYSWTIQKNDALILGTAVPLGQDVSVLFERLRQKVSSHLEIPLEGPIKSESAYIERTLSTKALCWHGLTHGGGKGKSKGQDQNKNKSIKDVGETMEGLVFLGEAAGATSPTSAEGFSYALKTSWNLCTALDKGIIGVEGRYAKQCRGIALNIVGKRLKMPAMYCAPLRNLVMRSGVTSI